MKRTLKILGIILGVLIILIAIFAIFFWFRWKRGNELYDQADYDYEHGNPLEASLNYQKYLDKYAAGDNEHRISLAESKLKDLQEFLQANQLQQDEKLDDAVMAYGNYIEQNYQYEHTPDVYYYLAHENVIGLKQQLVQKSVDQRNHKAAIEGYQSLLDYGPLINEDCQDEYGPYHEACKKLEGKLLEAQGEATQVIPSIFVAWSDALNQGENNFEFVQTCDDLINHYPSVMTDSVNLTIQPILEGIRSKLPEWLLNHPAIPIIEYAESVSRNSEGLWILTTHFKEQGGMLGYTISGFGYIIDAQGERWQQGYFGGEEIERGEVLVSKGGEGEDTYRLKGDVFIEGDIYFTWQGEDEGGNSILLEEKVHLLP